MEISPKIKDYCSLPLLQRLMAGSRSHTLRDTLGVSRGVIAVANQTNNIENNASNSTAAPFSAGLRLHSHNNGQAEKLQFERTNFLYSNLPIGITISLLLALILVYVQLPVIPPPRLFGWLAVLFAVSLGRAVVFIAWKTFVGAKDAHNTAHWLLWFRVGTIIAGIVWGVGGILLAPSGDIGHKIFVSLTLGGLCAGASATLSIDRASVIGFLLTILLPQIVFLASEEDTISHGMSAMLILFTLFLLYTALQWRLRLEEHFRLRHIATEGELRLRQMLESSPIATLIIDAATNKVVFANKSYISLVESSPERVIGLIPSDYYANPDEYTESMTLVQQGKNINNKLIELHSLNEDSWTKWALASYFAVEYQNKAAILGWLYDITDRKLMEDKVEHMAYHDTLTGLPNRYLFLDRLEQAIANADREQSALALLFVDLDKFKPVNDQYGHNIGDLLLMAVAERIRSCLRKTDSAARFGGDEFVILLPSIKSDQNTLKIAENIRTALDQLFHIETLTLDISSSTGVAIYPLHAKNGEQLIKHADIAMYHAKNEGRNCVKLYQPGMLENND
jgi:diguanylate cyclase (GGDEF)-like protein/PAS domain S-box-containing protein